MKEKKADEEFLSEMKLAVHLKSHVNESEESAISDSQHDSLRTRLKLLENDLQETLPSISEESANNEEQHPSEPLSPQQPTNENVLLSDTTCAFCNKIFASAKTLKRHLLVCPRKPKSPDSMVSEIKTEKLDVETLKVKELPAMSKDKAKVHKPYHCGVCEREFRRKYDVYRHMQESRCGGKPPPKFPCQICGKLFGRTDNLREHMRVHGVETSRRKYVCEHCNKDFHCPSVLTVHIRVHTGEKPFACETCQRAFPCEKALEKHRRTHTGERPYECTECGARFSLKGTLNRHLRTHTGIRPHKCQFCEKEFIQVGSLRAHLFHHTGENGFPCPQCGKCFNSKTRLRMHERSVHEKIKPYKCEICGRAFARKENLGRHSVLHTGIKAYQCPTCNKSFAIKPCLKVHLLTHKKEEPKTCLGCGKTFIRKDCLIRHMRKRHREMLNKLTPELDETKEVTSQQLLDKIADISVATDKNADLSPSGYLPKQLLFDSIKELLTLLVDEDTLKSFGWPDKEVNQLLECVIRHCGHMPVNPAEFKFMDRLRENCKLLFTVIIDHIAVKTLLTKHTVDQVILHVLHLAKN